ncbi:MAG: hypothetical protein ABSF50_04780 [Burkholderiaceae bacterium]|jgi:hypothetical protein
MQRAWPDVDSLTEADVTLQAGRFRGGLNNWIIQTYLHVKEPLLRRGIEVSISETFVSGAVNVAHRDSLNRVFLPYYSYYIVGVRADRPRVYMCDWEIVQNQIEPCTPKQSSLPVWPQPGLLSRDPARGSRIERMAYFGRTGTAARWLSDPGFHEALENLGVRFEIREEEWFNYADVDIVLAHRKEAPAMLAHKPASKLINAWIAGTPALLADEPAYRCLRRSELDFLAVDSAQDVLAAIRRLKTDPLLYYAMVHNGHVRAVDYSVNQVRELWLECLAERALPDALSSPPRGAVEGWWLQARRMIQQKAVSHDFKVRYARERAEIQRAQAAR